MTSIDSVILSYLTFAYFLSFCAYLLMLIMGRPRLGQAATIITVMGFAAQTLAIIWRWIASHRLGIGHAPLSNLYESLIFFAWAIILLYLVFERRTRNRSLGAFVTPLAFLILAYASFSPDVSARIMPLVPALKSNWLIVHVLTCFFGYAAFALSFGLCLMYLLKLREAKSGGQLLRRLPAPRVLDELNYQMVVIGFLMLTLGIITGSVWAHSAWGSYWSWDPKETWSLITWLVYAAVLHSRLVRGWQGKRLVVLCLIGFACVLFTYFGVNYLPGLHSYAQS